MALYWSTGLRQFVAQHGSYKRALQGGVMIIYSGTVPSSADAVAGSYTNQLVRITLASGAYTPETQSSAALTLSGGAGGSLDTLTVGKSGETAVEILGLAIAWDTDLTTTASNAVAQIQKYLSNPEYEVSSSGAVITVKSLMGTGTAQNGFILNSTTTIPLWEDTPQTFAGGVSAVNGLTYLYATAGILTKTGTWSGVISNTGTASYWRIYGCLGNEWGAASASTTAIRVQGTCGVGSTYDYNMASTSLTAGITHIIETFNLEVPVS